MHRVMKMRRQQRLGGVAASAAVLATAAALATSVGAFLGPAHSPGGSAELTTGSRAHAGPFLGPRVSELLTDGSEASELDLFQTSRTVMAGVGIGALLGLGAVLRRATTKEWRSSACFAGASAPALVGLGRAGTDIGAQTRRLSVACRAIFERFTGKSMKAVMMAQAESRKLGLDHVGAEMLVVGIIAEASDLGARALEQLGVTLPVARKALEETAGQGDGGKAIEIPFTADAKQVLEDSIECARSQGSATVGTAQLLQAILKQEEGAGTKLLVRLLDCDTAEAARLRVLPAIAQQELSSGQASPGGAAGSQGAQGASAGGVPGKGGAAAPSLELTETLKYSEDITQLAMDGKLDPLVGRKAQLERTVRILGRRSKNNPVLVGEAGVGKTSIAHGLAQRIAQGRVPPTLQGKRVLQLDLALLLAGTRYRGDFEERLRAVVKEVTESNRQVILVIDEVHTLVGAGSGGGGEGGGMDAANLLKPALARGELQCIGATTLDEYRQYIERDPALERRFQPVLVPEPTEEEAEQILVGVAPKYEKHHQLRYTPEALKASVKLASQYISDRYLPDKAIDVMDEAGSKVRQQLFQEAESEEAMVERRALNLELKELRMKKKQAVASEQYDVAQRLKVQEDQLSKRLEQMPGGGGSSSSRAGEIDLLVDELQALRAQVQEAVDQERFDDAGELKVREREVLNQLPPGGDQAVAALDRQVTEQDVAEVVAGWTGIAVEQVSASESARLMRLEELLHESIIGQNEAVQAVSKALRRARAGLRNPARPIAGFMFSGPTGVGKTHVCKTLAETFFGSSESMIRLDMSEFMEKHTVSKLIGAPPGYVGYSDGGTLTEAVRRKPYSLVLFDEVEKAHPDVFNMMLQLLDDGRLTDSKGRTVSFANTMIVMTTNLGSRSVQKGAGGGMGLGFGTEDNSEEASYSVVKELVHEEMKSFFRPEFLNRLDETVVFRPLTREDVSKIAEVEFTKVVARLRNVGFEVSLTERFKDHVVTEGFDPAYGARPLRRAITRLLEDKMAEHLLTDTSDEQEVEEGEQQEHCRVLVDVGNNGSVTVHQLRNSVLA